MGRLLIHGHTMAQLDARYAEKPAEFFQAQRQFMGSYRREHDGELPHTTFVDYLRERYERHPVRFEKYHPLLARWFDAEPQSLQPVVPVTPLVPIVGVPEPSSGML